MKTRALAEGVQGSEREGPDGVVGSGGAGPARERLVEV